MITLRFTFGERKICVTIKKSRNIMNMIVVPDIFLFFKKTLYEVKVNSLQLVSTNFDSAQLGT